MNLNPVKGMRDYMPEEMSLRRSIIEKIRSWFEKYGFQEVMTPAVERLEVLQGKYGEEEKLMWKFQDLGGRWVALKYDQTVPLARIVSKYRPRFPFRRYTIDRSWRYENPQKGRLREFVQADADIVGPEEGMPDAEILALASDVMKDLGFKGFRIRINDRRLVDRVLDEIGIERKEDAMISLDKLEKIGEEGVVDEMEKRGIDRAKAEEFLKSGKMAGEFDEYSRLMEIKSLAEEMGAERIEFDFSLVRGLAYYTGMVLEIQASPDIGSVGGGGRYDNMIGMFGFPAKAVGMSFGVERLFELLKDEPKRQGSILCSFASDSYTARVLRKLRGRENLSVITGKKVDKMLKYADAKNFRYAYIIGPDEEEKREVRKKDLETGEEIVERLVL